MICSDCGMKTDKLTHLQQSFEKNAAPLGYSGAA